MDETTGNKSTGQLHLKSMKRHIRRELFSELIINTAKSQVRVRANWGEGIPPMKRYLGKHSKKYFITVKSFHGTKCTFFVDLPLLDGRLVKLVTEFSHLDGADAGVRYKHIIDIQSYTQYNTRSYVA